ncbi:MAG: GtrA family protein [Mycobacterium sp.]|uniref:GtrA family protein n=1 Tax=Mycobacterium sp. TaxID=1785 RepID=UPI001EC802D4|nr:GtrA family protein [Mycobacterium sp.]MBW0017790.1 GtrA family protein [Mycobacterium sp.]
MEFVGGLIARSDSDARKKLRYVVVAVAFLPFGQGLIQILGPWLKDYTTASLLAAAIATVPNFYANRHFVWRVTSGKNLRNQILMFWVVVMLGVLLATIFTYLVDNVVADRTTLVRGTAVFIAQVVGFGIVWVGRFLVLDRWLFKSVKHVPELTAEIPT